MLLAEAGFLCVILYISGVQGRSSRICALKGSSVELPCTAQHLTSSMTWFTVQWINKILQNDLLDGNHSRFNVSEERNFTLTITDLRESDADVYCCGNRTDNPGRCWVYRTELRVTDVQVKVIPSTEGQTVTLMCSTSCPLTEHPAGYIWYKNREFLYQDWSPWYQQLVSSEEAATYSCAIRGYEDLRAPQVSVDSVTPTCFTVTYAEGRMCPDNQKSANESCSITYPREVHVERTPSHEEYVRLTCTPSCNLTDPQTTYRWYWKKRLYKYYEGQNLTVPGATLDSFSCAVKDHEDLHTADVCPSNHRCWSVNYIRRRICALEGSSVNISSEYSMQPLNSMERVSKLWYKIQRNSQDAENLTGRLEYHDDMNGSHILRIENLRRDDSAEYTFRLKSRFDKKWQYPDSPGVTLVVTGLKVKFTPSAEVTEDQRVTLTCSTSCPLPDNTTYIWFFNSRPLTPTENQNKHLVLDPVSSQHAGNYSCAVTAHSDISSSGQTFTVKGLGKSMAIINTVRLVLVFLIPIPLLLFHLWLRCTSSL